MLNMERVSMAVIIVILIGVNALFLILLYQERTGDTVFYYSETSAFAQIQDYYIECDGNKLINITPLGNPIIIDKVRNLCHS